MNRTIKAYLELIRLPNLCTAVADVVAGYLYVGGDVQNISKLIPLALTSVCLYAGGVALNDVCDLKTDRSEQPARPIPSGRVRPGSALILSILLLTGGLSLACVQSMRVGYVATSIVICIVLYDVILKRTFLAPSIMGLCRAGNLCLGLSYATFLVSPQLWIPVFLMWLYVTSVTTFARRETVQASPFRLHLATIGVCLAVGCLSVLVILLNDAQPMFLTGIITLVILLGRVGFRAATTGQPSSVQSAVTLFILSIILFDACLVWSSAGIAPALSLSLLVLPTWLLGRLFRMT